MKNLDVSKRGVFLMKISVKLGLIGVLTFNNECFFLDLEKNVSCKHYRNVL